MSSNADPSIEVTIKSFQDIVRKLGDDFTEPDQDWLGMVICQSEEGDHFIPALFRDEEEKWLFSNVVVPTVILKVKPYAVCQVLSAWMVEGGKDDHDMLNARPAQHPRRTEVMIIIVITSDWEQGWSAPIIRFPDKPPKLGPWRLWEQADSIVGDFFTPIREALLSLEET